MTNEPVLCYISNNFAYFTTRALSKQWGDDWDDAPYEHNAGTPYGPHNEDEHWEIKVVAYKHPNYATPGESRGANSGYSVEMINRKNVAWLADYWTRNSTLPPIFAGTTMSEFIRMIRETGGTAGVLE